MTITFGKHNTPVVEANVESEEFDLKSFLNKYGVYIELGLICFSIFFLGQVVGVRKILIR